MSKSIYINDMRRDIDEGGGGGGGSSSAEYSTSEKVIGKWIDGSTVYRRVVILKKDGVTQEGVTMRDSNNYQVEGIYGSVEKVVNYNIFWIAGGNDYTAKNEDVQNNHSAVRINGEIYCAATPNDIWAIIEYTKGGN